MQAAVSRSQSHFRRAASRLWWFQNAMESPEMPECFVAKATDLKDGEREGHHNKIVGRGENIPKGRV